MTRTSRTSTNSDTLSFYGNNSIAPITGQFADSIKIQVQISAKKRKGRSKGKAGWVDGQSSAISQYDGSWSFTGIIINSNTTVRFVSSDGSVISREYPYLDLIDHSKFLPWNE